jgi:hypothetical protein
MSLDLPFWILEGAASEPIHVVRAGTPMDPELEPMPAGAALAWLSRWLLDARAREVLADIHGTLFGVLSLTPWGEVDLHRPLHQALATAIELGDLLVLERMRESAAVVPPVSPSAPPPPKLPPVTVLTFIEIELVDQSGRRFPTRLRVTLPDGTGRQPAFDGFVRIDGLEPGTCDIEFPDIDGREWGPAPPGVPAGGQAGTVFIAQQGDCLSSIAQRFAFLNWRTIYDDPQNKGLRAARPNPNVLAPGDKVFVPQKQPRIEESPTGTRAVYRVLTTSTRLRIAFEGKRVNDYELSVGGQTFTGQVSEGGLIDHLIPASATEGDLVLRPVDAPGHEDRWKILLGVLDPIEQLTGVQGRLNNLGFPCPVEGTSGPETTAAVQAFQRWRGLGQQDGKLDAATRAEIQKVHDG